MKIGMVYARARNGVIGRDNQLPWHLPEDLAHFKRVTLGAPVLMGRRTWDSLPGRFRPLPGRRNIVITRQPAWQAEGAERQPSLAQALDACRGEPQVWIIGGAEIYREALPWAHCAEVTEIDRDFEGTAHAPDLGPAWQEVARERHTSAEGLPFSFVSYVNTGAPA
jgi:dihydrofolate reductase